MKQSYAKWLLAGVIIIRSTATLISKIGLTSMGPFTLLLLRFMMAFILLLILLNKQLRSTTKRELLHGALIGFAFFCTMAFEMLGLQKANASTVSFLENTAIVIVPLLQALFIRKLPSGRTLFCAAITLLGVALLTLQNGLHLSGGEGYCMLAALCYAISMILTDRFARTDDPIRIGVFQVGFMGVFSGIAAFAIESPRMPETTNEWIVIILLAVVCTCFGFTLQPLAQKHVPVDTVAQFCALNPLAAAVLSVIFLHEQMNIQGVLGGTMILTGILILSRASNKCIKESQVQDIITSH